MSAPATTPRLSAAEPADLSVVQRRGALALAGRETRRVLTLWSQTILPQVITAVLFLAIFAGALGDRLQSAGGGAGDYLGFILPGLLVMTVANGAFANSSTSLFQAKNEGYLEDILSSPLAPWRIVAGYVAGGLVRGWLSAAAVAAVALPFTDGIRNPLPALAALILTGLIFAALGVVTGVWAESWDRHAFIANLVIAPLALLAGVFYAPDRLGEPWSTLTLVDPLFYLVDAARTLVTGDVHAPWGVALVVAAAVAAAVLALAVWIVRIGWRLKP